MTTPMPGFHPGDRGFEPRREKTFWTSVRRRQSISPKPICMVDDVLDIRARAATDQAAYCNHTLEYRFHRRRPGVDFPRPRETSSASASRRSAERPAIGEEDVSARG
ncbi:hypothetical protein F1559_001301 [Cyanidiococcus yangmingshanensis]|uniref:Uncharacterized protein n=1 Tax=Cyanidiococcus yangmingshanensis TaxID=2690220 RepID=A0A7J7IED3_9RHOD|nr:hypothetical protein F1559_001301 [Cyanidiococcus yangmingshanensis]